MNELLNQRTDGRIRLTRVITDPFEMREADIPMQEFLQWARMMQNAANLGYNEAVDKAVEAVRELTEKMPSLQFELTAALQKLRR